MIHGTGAFHRAAPAGGPASATTSSELGADLVLIATGALAAGAPGRRARRRADPQLAAGLRPAGAARAPRRRRIRRDRRGVRQRLPRARQRGDPGVEPRPGAAERGRRRGAADRGRLHPARHAHRRQGASGRRPSGRRRRRGRAAGRPDGRAGRTAWSRSGSVPEHCRARVSTSSASRPTSAATSASTGSPGPPRPGIYAAGDCTGLLLLASVAAMQGRTAMWHALGDAVAPLRLSTVSANVFTDPEIATVGLPRSRRPRARGCAGGEAAARHQRAREDAGDRGRLRQALLPAGHRRGARRRRRGAAGERADPAGVDRGADTASPSTSSPTRSRSIPRSPAASPKPPASSTAPTQD